MKNSIPRYTFYKYKYGSELLVDVVELKYVKKFLAKSAVHTLNYYDITFITEGKGAFSVDNQTYEAIPRDVLFSKPGEIRNWDTHHITNGYALIFEEEFLSFLFKDSLFVQHLSFFQIERCCTNKESLKRKDKNYLFVQHLSFFQIESSSSLLHLSDELYTRILETLHDIKMEIDSYQQGDVHVLRALLYEVLMLLDRAYLKMTSIEEGRSREVSNNHVSKFMNLVATHAKEQHSVQYYADKLCITPNYLNEMITSTMGFSAKQYIQGKVMEEAKRLLVYTDFPIADIAFELCFSTVSYFIRSFRQHTGETPLLYRKVHKP